MSWQKTPPNEVGFFSSNQSWSGIKANNYVGGLLSGSKWGDNNPDNGKTTDLLYYYFPENYYTFSGNSVLAYELTNPEKVAIQNAMDSFSHVANISFSKTNNYDNANIKWAVVNTEGSNILAGTSGEAILGVAFYPKENSGQLAGITTVNFQEYDPFNYSKALKPGSFYYSTFLHELGHALGLGHPHEKHGYYGTFPGVSNGASLDAGDNNLNSAPWTVMTYNDHDSNVGLTPSGENFSGFNTNLGAFDIAVTQYLYGPNTNYNTGNNVYDLNENELNGWKCIWDNGGRDKISATGSNQSVNIDLRNASLQNAIGGGGFVSQLGSESLGFTIAFNSTGNCIIEDATGSNFNDIITGNSAANTLNGRSGNDKIYGRSGNDKIYGGSGNDHLIGGSGKDTAVFSSRNNTINIATTKRQTTGDGNDILTGIENVNGGSGSDVIYGSKGSNTLNGGKGNDFLFGGLGNDRLVGGSGKDTAAFSSRNNTINIATTKRQTTGDGNDILTGIENVNGGAGNDVIYGSKGSNILNGGKGNDFLFGGLGDDKIIGGKGKDIFKLSKGKGYDLIQDFKDKQDKIFIGSKKLKLRNKGKDVFIYSGKDLLAKVKKAKGLLSKKGKYLV